MKRNRTDYYRRYLENNREAINERSRERYAQSKTPKACRPDVPAFVDALEEIEDVDVQAEIQSMIDATATLFMQRGNLKEHSARNQATEFVGALVWNKATAPRKATYQQAIGD